MKEALIIIMLFCSSVGLFWILVNQLLTPIYDIKDAIIKRRIKKSGLDPAKVISISVVVPAWNEEVGIQDTLRSLFRSNYNNLEVIVVDDGSNDMTTKKVIEYYQNEFLLKHADNNKYLGLIQHPSNAGKGEALNTGIKAASGDVIITVDGDSVFMKNTVRNIAKYFLDPSIDAVEGNIKVSNHKSFIGMLQKIEYQMGCHYKRAFTILGCEYVMPGAVAAFRKEIFKNVGLLDKVCKTEDLEFTFRVRKNGYNIYFAEDAVVWTEGASTIQGLIKQRIRWKKGRLDAMIHHKDMIYSRSKKINKFLSHFILPFIILSDAISLLMPILSVISIGMLITNQDYNMVLAWFVLNAISTMIPIMFGYKNSNWKVILMSPFYFVFYHVLSFIEAWALIKSIYLVLRGEDVIWQDWKRKGVMNV